MLLKLCCLLQRILKFLEIYAQIFVDGMMLCLGLL